MIKILFPFEDIDLNYGIDEKQISEASEELKKIKETIAPLQPASKSEIELTIQEIKNDKKALKIFGLFGTSGIRGVLKNLYSDVVQEYADKTFISPKLAYYYGRAYGMMMVNLKMDKKVCLNMDPRPSSFMMASSVTQGLLEQGIDVFFNGIAATPMASLYKNGIVITASHNELRFNGIKAFIGGIPITFNMEWFIECRFRMFDRLEKKRKTIRTNEKRGKVFYTIQETHKKYLQLGQTIIKQENLENSNPLKCYANASYTKTIMPLDLAYGAAGATISKQKLRNLLSPQLKLLLDTGTIIVGFGTEKNGFKTNYRVGAAYPYGETPETICEGELEAFAKGMYGYGDNKKGGHISRSFYFPHNYDFKDTALRDQSLHIEGAYVFIDVDNSSKILLSKILKEIEGYELLPACSVDCDEDRFLATSKIQSKKTIPYLSGDLMIMLFASNLKESIKKVVFTIESGLSIAKFLEKKQIPYEEVTVGDRAIADYIMDKDRLAEVEQDQRPKIMGGEPSGHMMFGAIEKDTMVLIDDPIISQLKILGMMRKKNKSFDLLIQEITDEVEEVYTARKPESWAGEPNSSGISLSEKIRLELRERGNKKLVLTEYAKLFIPEYISIFSEGYINAYYKNIPEHNNQYPNIKTTLIFSKEYNRLIDNGRDIKGLIEYLEVARISFSTKNNCLIEELVVKLRMTNKNWAGPSDINLSFFSKDKDKQFSLAGGVATRNSGTSPKNSGYNKLWFEHYPSGRYIESQVIQEITTKMAKKRVTFTDNFVRQLRSNQQ